MQQGHGLHEAGKQQLDGSSLFRACAEHSRGRLLDRADPALHHDHAPLRYRQLSIATSGFRGFVKGWNFPGERQIPVLTWAPPNDHSPEWCAWLVDQAQAEPVSVYVAAEDADRYSGLGDAWPLDVLNLCRFTIFGVGSLGSAAAEILQAYGARHFALVDPDRLKTHNVARHQLTQIDIGRFKVNAVKDEIVRRDPDAEVQALPLDVVEDADKIRSLLRDTTIAMVCTDGVESRAVANHLVCQAGVTAVFACVLEDGGIGEVLRVIPGVSQCLQCFREALVKQGAFDPEPGLDLEYGTGFRHRAMTAVGGDLELVAGHAAKVAIGTLLERAGHWRPRPAAGHAVIGLRPEPWLPAPFDVAKAGEVKWHEPGAPALDCPSCRVA